MKSKLSDIFSQLGNQTGSFSVPEKSPDESKKRPNSLHLCKYEGKTAEFTKKEPGNVVSYQFYTPLMRHQARQLWQQKTGYRQADQNNWRWQKNGTAI